MTDVPMPPPLQAVTERASEMLNEARTWFTDHREVTLIVRCPGKPDRDFMMTSDTPEEILALLARRMGN